MHGIRLNFHHVTPLFSRVFLQPEDQISQAFALALAGQFLRCSLKDDAALTQEEDPSAESLHFFHSMRGQNHGSSLLGESLEASVKMLGPLRVQTVGRLIQQQQRRTVDRGTGERQTTSVALGKLTGRFVGEVLETVFGDMESRSMRLE